MSNLDAAQLFGVKGLVAVITGASSGLGTYMAHALDVNGASKVFILGRREDNLKQVASKAVSINTCPLPSPSSFFSLTPFVFPHRKTVP